MPDATALREGFDRSLFNGAADAELLARVAVQMGPLPVGAFEESEAMFRDLAMVDDRRSDDGDAAPAVDAGLRRVEAKLDLTLRLLARALPGLAVPPLTPVRLGLRGVRLDGPCAVEDESAVLRWQPAEWMPLPLLLPVRAAGRSAHASWWAFDVLPMPLAEALERHVFRLHRRMLAARKRN